MQLKPCIFVLIAATAASPSSTPRAADAGSTTGDSLYNAHHPRLLFTAEELQALRAKVRDGGYDDQAYALLRFLADNYYPFLTPADMVAMESGLNPIPNLGLAAYLESPPDTAALGMGRDVTVYTARNFEVDDDEANSGLRLRALTLGYDMFFADAPDSVRSLVRDEIVSYVTHMTTTLAYELFELPPYLGNHSAMFAAPLGLAAICLRDEADPTLLDEALATADAVIDSLFTRQFDPGGAYKEGCLYGAWTLRQLVYYFHARKRYDGFDYADHPTVRAAEKWFAFEILPGGSAKTNNLNDSPMSSTPLALHNSYFEWAQSNVGSGLSAWIWDHTSGPQGVDLGASADKAATVLWNLGLAPVQPDSVLPRSRMWADRGLYYYRSGWQSGASSRDVVFSFYSGKFHGGHAQEDQNQFTLYAYGGNFAIDHGAGATARQSEAHNIVFVDGAGQHNAGNSIGTDGRIASYLLSDFADFVAGDATAAYTTYSEFNAPDWPIAGWDWSWGYQGANPVRVARRDVLAVHDSDTPPYFVVADNIDKDGLPHDYQWRFHTLESNSVDVSTNPIRVDAQASVLDIHLLHPDFAATAATTQHFDNGESEPDATLLALTHTTVNPHFTVLLLPADSTVTRPSVTRQGYAWGFACLLHWGGWVRDVVIGNHSGGSIWWGRDLLQTDAPMAVVRTEGSAVTRYLLVEATSLDYGGNQYVRFIDGPASCALAGGVVHIDRCDADFVFLDTGIERIECRGQPVPFVRENGRLYAAGAVAAGDGDLAKDVAISVYPVPFNPSVTIEVHGPVNAHLNAKVYDAAGRLVAELMDGPARTGVTTIRWNAVNRSGRAVPSGVYFLKVSMEGVVRTRKLVVVR